MVKNTKLTDPPNKTAALIATESGNVNSRAAILPIYYQGPIELAQCALKLLAQINLVCDSLLRVAAKIANYGAVEFLLRCWAYLFYKNKALKNVTQLSIANNTSKCVLDLLKHDAVLFQEFRPTKTSNAERKLLGRVYLRQKYTDLLKHGKIKKLSQAIDAQIINPLFRGLDNQSVLLITFVNQQYEVFVRLKSIGFREFENLFEIKGLIDLIYEQMLNKRDAS